MKNEFTNLILKNKQKKPYIFQYLISDENVKLLFYGQITLWIYDINLVVFLFEILSQLLEFLLLILVGKKVLVICNFFLLYSLTYPSLLLCWPYSWTDPIEGTPKKRENQTFANIFFEDHYSTIWGTIWAKTYWSQKPRKKTGRKFSSLQYYEVGLISWPTVIYR